MGWRDLILRPASYKGAAFKVEQHEQELGRRTEVHEFPFRSGVEPEDLGLATGRMTVQAFVVGEDCDAQAEALARALNSAGPGTLVHPYLGTLQASVTSARRSEMNAEGGIVRFSLEFVEAGINVAPGVEIDTRAAAEIAAGGLDAVTISSMQSGFTTLGQPQFVSDAAADLLSAGGEAFAGAGRALTGSGAQLYSLVTKVEAVRSGALALVRLPVEAANQVLGLAAAVGSVASTPRDALRALRPLLGFGENFALVVGLSPARRQQRTNQQILVAAVRSAAACAAVRAAAAITFTSYDDAVGIRDGLADDIDRVALAAGDAGDDGGYLALQKLRLALVADVTVRGGSLARLRSMTLQAVEPALVIAQRLYGTAGRADEVVARNKISHPGFVPAGVPLEVLTDG